MNRTNSLIVPQKRSALPLLLGLLIGSAGLAYGYMRWQRPAEVTMGQAAARPQAAADPPGAPAEPAGTEVAAQAVEGRGEAPAPAAPAEPAGPGEGAASTNGGAAPEPVQGDGKGGEQKGGEKGAEQKGAATIKMDPLIANLDEGDQLRYLKLSVQLEVTAEAQQRIQAALPRARHEALMYMSGLHLSDVQGMLGKQRVHRELQRRIADAVGSGLKRIYFDEFVVQ